MSHPSAIRVAARYSEAAQIRVFTRKLPDGRTVQLTEGQLAAVGLMPKGHGLRYNISGGTLRGLVWSKSGGYIDALSRKFWPALKALGFHRIDSSEGSTPDGSRSSSSTVYRDSEGNTITSYDHTGVTQYENSYSFELKFKHPAPILTREAQEEARQAETDERQTQIAESVLSSVRGPTKSTRGFGDTRLERDLGKDLQPSWAQAPGKELQGNTLTVNPSGGEVSVFAYLQSTRGNKYLRLEESYNPEDGVSLAHAIGSLLDQFKRAPPSAFVRN